MLDPRRPLLVPGLGRIDPTVRNGWRAYRDGWPIPVQRPGEFPAARASWFPDTDTATAALVKAAEIGAATDA